MELFSQRSAIMLAALGCAWATHGQIAFSLDTTFQCEFEARNVVDALLLPDGDVLVSGALRYPNDEFGVLRGGVRLNPDGSDDPSLPLLNYMGAHLVPWQDKLYTGGSGIRRLNMNDFSLDPSWDLINAPMILLFQYGQYHVFPDGRVLMGGLHDLVDPDHGFVGSYELVWLTNTGQLDTTRIHRNANGATYRLEQTADGKFMCFGFGTVYEGHPVPRVFRVLSDGAWDSTFVAPLVSFTGFALDFEELPDGRVYSAGRFFIQGEPDTLHVVRFMPDGSLDPSFNQSIEFTQTPSVTPGGAILGGVRSINANRILVFGNFDRVDGQFHRGICMIDSLGNVLHDYFQGDGCGPTNYNGSQGNSIEGVLPIGDGDWYIYGAFEGYDDGTIDDPQQGFISRLHEGDLGMAATPMLAGPLPWGVYPNPTVGLVQVSVVQVPVGGVVVLRDVLGRQVLRRTIIDNLTTLAVDVSGVLTVELWDAQDLLGIQRVVVE